MNIDSLRRFADYQKISLLLLILIARCLIIISTWYIARTSFVYLIKFDQNIHTNLAADFLLFIPRVIVALILEITITTRIPHSFQDNHLLNKASWNRLLQANFFLIIAEISMLVALSMELDQLQNINFVLSIISTASLLWILFNPTGYIIQWIILTAYALGIFVLMFPRNEDANLKSLDIAAIVLLLRSILLPV
jgi:hypothetical protein